MATTESGYTITFTSSTSPEGVAEVIDVRSKYLKFQEHGLWLTGCWEWTVFKHDETESKSFQIGTAFFPWHRVADVSDVYDSLDHFGTESLPQWTKDNGLDPKEIQKADKAFRIFNEG